MPCWPSGYRPSQHRLSGDGGGRCEFAFNAGSLALDFTHSDVHHLRHALFRRCPFHKSIFDKACCYSFVAGPPLGIDANRFFSSRAAWPGECPVFTGVLQRAPASPDHASAARELGVDS